MIDMHAEIISNISIANIFLGDNINDYLNEIYSNHSLKTFNYSLPDNEIRMAYIIDDTIEIATLSTGLIISLGCNEKYNGYYKNILRTGMKMSDIIKNTDNQSIFNGCIIINDDFGFSIEIPPPYDEIADYIEHIPHDLIFNKMRIADFGSWLPTKNNTK